MAVNGDMDYEPSHRRPPRQERWPNATPQNAWPAYRQDDAGQAPWPADAMAGRASHGYAPAPSVQRTRRDSPPWDGSAWESPAWDGAAAGYGGGVATAYPRTADRVLDGFDGVPDGYTGTADGYAGAADGYTDWDGYGTEQEFAGPAGYLEPDEAPAYASGASSVLVAPDMVGDWWRQPDQDAATARDDGRDGLVIGAVMGFLSAAVAIGVATLAGGLIRPQASPVSVIGAVLLDRLPAGPRATVTAHLGAHGGSVLLLGLAAVVAVVAGVAARRNAGRWVLGLAAFGLLGSFVAVTRPGSRTIDVLPPAAGVAAGILALLWLARRAAPLITAPLSSARVTPARARSGASSGRRSR